MINKLLMGDTLVDVLVMPSFQHRLSGLEVNTIARYKEAMLAGAKFPPVSLIELTDPYNNPVYYLFDGFHRLAAYDEALKANNNLQPPHPLKGVIKYHADSLEEAKEQSIVLGYEINSLNGLPPTKADRDAYIVALFKQGHSSEVIAERLGISRETVDRATRSARYVHTQQTYEKAREWINEHGEISITIIRSLFRCGKDRAITIKGELDKEHDLSLVIYPEEPIRESNSHPRGPRALPSTPQGLSLAERAGQLAQFTISEQEATQGLTARDALLVCRKALQVITERIKGDSTASRQTL